MKRFALTALTVISALALYSTSASNLALAAVVLLAVLGLVGERLEIPPRALLVLALVSLVTPFLLQPAIPRGSGFLFEPAFSLAVGLSACMGSAVLLLRVNRGWEEQLLLVSSIFTLLVAGNTTHALPLAYLVGAFTLFLVLYLRVRSFGLRVGTVGSTIVALLCALGLAVGLSWIEGGFNNFFFSMQSWSASINFGDIAGIKPQSGPGGTKVLVRVFSDDPENYLAARRYVKYEGGKWKGASSKLVRPEQHQGQNGYLLHGSVEQGWQQEGRDRIEVTTLNPDALLAPLNTRFVAVELDRAKLSWCGDLVVESSGAGFNGSYEVVLGGIPIEESEENLQQCLQVEVAPEVAELAHQVAGDGSAEFKVFKLVKYFQENFEYGFGYPFDRAEDPVAEFLKERPPAHCEVFATCLALMCREVGVPARYVQGFLVKERNEWGGYWVSRERDAHAWVEVYIEGMGWVQVDATPPGVSAPVDSDSSWSEFADVVKRWFQRGWAFIARGPTAMLRDLASFLSEHPLGAGLILLSAIVWRFRKRLRGRPESAKKIEDKPPHPRVVQLQSLLTQYEQRIGQSRPRGLTILEWAESQTEGRSFLTAYSEARYSREVPDEEAITRIAALLSEVRQQDRAG